MTPVTIGAEPARIDVDLTAGEAVDFTVPVYDGDDAAQDLAGWTLTAQVHTQRGATLLHAFTLAVVAPSGTVGADDYDPGGVQVTATSDETAAWAAWPVALAPWSLWVTPPGNQSTPLAVGWVRVTVH